MELSSRATSRCFILVAPLDTSHTAQPGTDQHQSRIAVQETAHHTSAVTDFPVQPFNDIVGTDTGPVFAGKIAAGHCFLNAILHLLRSLFQLYREQLLRHGFDFLPSSLFALLGVDRLKHLSYQLYFGARRDWGHIPVKVDGTSLVFSFRKRFAYGLQHTKALITNNEFHAIQTMAA